MGDQNVFKIMTKPLTTSEITTYFTEKSNDNLPDPAILEAPDGIITWQTVEKGLTFKIPKFEDMSASRIHVQLSGLEAHFAIEYNHVGEDRDVELPISANELIYFQGNDVRAVYLQLDPPRRISDFIPYIVTARHEAPVIDDIDGDVLPWKDLSKGINIRIKASHGISTGDLLSIYCIGTGYEGSSIIRFWVEAEDLGKDIVRFIDPKYLYSSAYGEIVVFFSVESPDKKVTYSPLTRLKIQDGPIPKPETLFTRPEGHLPASALIANRMAFYQPAYQDMAVGDWVTMILLGEQRNAVMTLSRLITSSDVGKGLDFSFQNITVNGLGSNIELHFIVETLGRMTRRAPKLMIALHG
ncbi:hypothetical protein JFU48_03485 [Pseudomonas sp. TH49]|uniref:hypothetical protein n=1 Tax=Pseudomonas sp. TH49 TaxID=2796413 RepID=UPI001911C059|nr:hypothetical protein [Pseudomonas sp. TH49]MBK5340449.1 hypothetical protein [Pseudomonas sp. TH49]